MDISRRSFLKISSLGALGIGTAGNNTSARCRSKLPDQQSDYVTSVCPFCAVGCGLLVYREKTGLRISAAIRTTPLTRAPYAPRDRRCRRWSTTPAAWTRSSTARRAEHPLRKNPGPGRWSRSPNGSNIPGMPVLSIKKRTRSSTAPIPLPAWAARPWIMRSATFTLNLPAPWASPVSNIRPESDTAPRLPVWRPVSAGAP